MSTSRIAGRVLFVLGISVALSLSEAHADDSSPENSLLTIRGTVAMPDGLPAPHALVSSLGDTPAQSATVQSNELGQFQLEGEFASGCRLHLRSADETHQATLFVSAASARERAAEPIDVTLAPAREYVVTVASEGKSVDGAHVAAHGRGFRIDTVADVDGTVTLLIPAADALLGLVAWHRKLGVAGTYEPQGIEGATTQLNLLAPAPHTIQAIDNRGEPVPGLELAANIDSVEGFILAHEIEAAHLRTDAQGQATATWFPKGMIQAVVAFVDPMWKIDRIEQPMSPGGPTTVRVRRQRAVHGRLVMPAGASGEGILVTGFGFGPGNIGDIPNARARPDGSFTLFVPSDHAYVLGIADASWASDGWTGMILAAADAVPAAIALDVYPATPLEVRVTRGPQNEPIENAWVGVSSERSVVWQDSRGAAREAAIPLRYWLKTDAAGTARTGVGKGTHSLRLSNGTWGETQTVEIDAATPVSVDFHRPWIGKRRVAGRLMLGEAVHSPSAATSIQAWETSVGYYADVVNAVSRPDGTFDISIDVADFSILVVDPERHVAGLARVGPTDSTIDVALKLTAFYGGVVVDTDGRPLPGMTVRLSPEKASQAANVEQVTDDLGGFRFEHVLTDAPLTFRINEEVEGRTESRHYGKRLFLPGEVREDQRIVLSQPGVRIRSADPLEKRLARATRNARLNAMHALVVLQGASSEATAEKTDRILEEIVHSSSGVLPLVVDAGAINAESPDAQTIAIRGWTLPGAGELTLIEIDGGGRTLGSVLLPLDDMDAALKGAADFVARHAPPVRDARVLLDAAREEARRTDRRVWVVCSGTRCAPCLLLAHWMDRQHAAIERDYVVVKILEDRDERAAEVLAKFERGQSGIPWMVIADPDGGVLATGDGPLGNIGFPSSIEGRRHLRDMLGRTAKRLSAGELDQLVDSLTHSEE